jgi:putative DNA primase/helicase
MAVFAGCWQELGRYTSQSEADLALITKLLRITRDDPAMADLLFRMSGLMDEKWERVDYKEWTLDRAMSYGPETRNRMESTSSRGVRI